jgi:hypothetical protein
MYSEFTGKRLADLKSLQMMATQLIAYQDYLMLLRRGFYCLEGRGPAATRRLATLIAALQEMPSAPLASVVIATRLIALLPRRGEANSRPREMAFWAGMTTGSGPSDI